VIVVDASVVVEIVLRMPAAAALERRLFEPALTAYAPHLLDIEVAQAIRRSAASGYIAPERGRQALADVADFPLHRYPHGFLLQQVWDLRNNLSAYDAVYVALAKILDAPLLTRDRRLANTASRHARIEVV
jgi:predicted nucleic acid-binding protein